MRIIKNPKANPKSKTQLLKAKRLKANPIQFVKCERCGAKHNQLLNFGGRYYCTRCMGRNHA